ncbi:hypothetical protein MP228_005139 [Amoeboaphelidium protococcarum]|nr:hypothetical protein MP228_005139 [Amoeboaphelidium protococcarum]
MELRAFVRYILVSCVWVLLFSVHSSDAAECGRGNLTCEFPQCCSSRGFCGTGTAYCGRGCKVGYGLCNSYKNADQCGSATSAKTSCRGQTECCNTAGFCATDPFSCGINCDRQLNGGFCFPKTQLVFRPLPGAASSSRNVSVVAQQCGVGQGQCPPGTCCNADNLCGVGDSDCDVNQGCQIDFGACLPTNYQCGPQFGNQLCNVNGWCCGAIGFCGITPDYCLPENGCVSGCSGTVTTSTSTTPTQLPTETLTQTQIQTQTVSVTVIQTSTSLSQLPPTTITQTDIPVIDTPTLTQTVTLEPSTQTIVSTVSRSLLPITTVLEIPTTFSVPFVSTSTIEPDVNPEPSGTLITLTSLITTELSATFSFTSTVNYVQSTLAPYTCDEFNDCPNNLCCSRFGFCGSSEIYCKRSQGCVRNCRN